MYRYIPVVDSKPDARKHGLRIKVAGVEVDEYNNITKINCYYSQYHTDGAFSLFASEFYPIHIENGKEADNGRQ